jgi:hypothetical protein
MEKKIESTKPLRRKHRRIFYNFKMGKSFYSMLCNLESIRRVKTFTRKTALLKIKNFKNTSKVKT